MPGKLSSCVSITAATSTIAEPVGWSAWPLFDFSGGPDRVTSKCYLASHVSHRCERNDDAPHIAFSLAIGMGYIPKLTVRVRIPSSAPVKPLVSASSIIEQLRGGRGMLPKMLPNPSISCLAGALWLGVCVLRCSIRRLRFLGVCRLCHALRGSQVSRDMAVGELLRLG